MAESPAQLALWRGAFGDAYTERNAATHEQIAARLTAWAEILATLTGPHRPRSVLEVGCNLGLNLRALRLLTDATLHAVEPNARAREVIVADGVLPAENLRADSAQAIGLPDGAVDLAFTSGVLIHIHPDDLLAACREIHRCSRRYVVAIEYFSDKPEMIPYRGETEALFKRDFGGFYLDHFPDLALRDYGFFWKRATGLDNMTWWLFEKTGA